VVASEALAGAEQPERASDLVVASRLAERPRMGLRRT